MQFSQEKVHRLVQLSLIKAMIAAEGKYFVPAAVSNRHVHLDSNAVVALFGPGYSLKKLKDLNQPGQYAYEEQVMLIGPKSSIEKIRVLGPERSETQVEISTSDAIKVGIEPIIRISGKLDNTPGCILAGPHGKIMLNRGVIVSKRHLHISEEQASWFDLKDCDAVTVRQAGNRPVVFEDILVRCGNKHELELHIDTDEANSAMIRSGSLLFLIKGAK